MVSLLAVPMAWNTADGAALGAAPGGWMSTLCDEQRAFLANTGHLHEIGDLVVVHSLSPEHGLNGRRGHIHQRMNSTGRLAVRMEAGLGLKPSNLWPVLDCDLDNEDKWMQDDRPVDEPSDGDDVGGDLGLGTRSHVPLHSPGMPCGTPKAAVVVWACDEVSEGPLVLEAAAGPHQARGDKDEAALSADAWGNAADQEQSNAGEGPAVGAVPLADPHPPPCAGHIWHLQFEQRCISECARCDPRCGTAPP